jgi:hypothetical protein
VLCGGLCGGLYNKLCDRLCADAIIIDRTIINNFKSNIIYVQHATPSIGGSYPCYTISESWLIDTLDKTYDLVESFDSLFFSELTEIDSTFKGYIFSKKEFARLAHGGPNSL